MEDAAPAVEPRGEPAAASTATTTLIDAATGQVVSTAAGTVAQPVAGLGAASATTSSIVIDASQIIFCNPAFLDMRLTFLSRIGMGSEDWDKMSNRAKDGE
ncbi:uncharacterized protein FFC1_13800 [Fusarium fujikuroi]|nr:uncharacterized protein FFC1_13800 [Fusarium fujikuroi]